MKKFTDFGLNETLLDALFYMNFEEATEIQEKAIPTILEGKDLIGCAQTGTGKTAAFVLPTKLPKKKATVFKYLSCVQPVSWPSRLSSRSKELRISPMPLAMLYMAVATE